MPWPSGTGRHLHPSSASDLGMTRRGRPPLPEVLQVAEGEAVAGQVQHGVLQDRGVPRGEDEAIPVGPVRPLGVVAHDPGPQHVGQRSQGHGGALVARARRVGSVHGQSLDHVDPEPLDSRHRPSGHALSGHSRLTIAITADR